MSKNQGASIISFVKWLTGKYIELERSTLPYPCKLADIVIKHNIQIAQIQFSGQSHLLEISVSTIIEKNLFEYFSPQDKKRLFATMYNTENLKLSDQFFCPQTLQEMITLTHIATGNKITIPLEAASKNDNIIQQLNSKDAIRIGFASGMEYLKKLFNNF